MIPVYSYRVAACLERRPRVIPKTTLSERLEPLGYSRLRLLSCLGGDMPHLPQYFAPGPQEDAFAAFRGFVDRMVRLCADANDPMVRSLIGAAQLLTGDLSGADVIVEYLPATPVKLDHGAGYCLTASQAALSVALPQLPKSLQDTSRWLAGSAEQAALRTWLEQHASQLVWDEPRALYVLGQNMGHRDE
jgi:hypothetical protein